MEEQLADPTDPAYSAEILKARAERVRAVQRWRTSLDTLNRMIDLRRSARVSRYRNGNVASVNDDSDLQRWRLDMETELLWAKAALSRLEPKVKADLHGEYPPGGREARADAADRGGDFARIGRNQRQVFPVLHDGGPSCRAVSTRAGRLFQANGRPRVHRDETGPAR